MFIIYPMCIIYCMCIEYRKYNMQQFCHVDQQSEFGYVAPVTSDCCWEYFVSILWNLLENNAECSKIVERIHDSCDVVCFVPAILCLVLFITFVDLLISPITYGIILRGRT